MNHVLRAFVLALIMGWGLAGNAAATTEACSPGNTSDAICSELNTFVGSDFSIFSFAVETAGFFTLSVIDFELGGSLLDQLTVALTTAQQTLDTVLGTESLTFFAAPGTYFLQVYAEAFSPTAPGAYSVNVAVNPVPLPNALLLFGCAAGLFFLTTRARRPDADGPAAAPA